MRRFFIHPSEIKKQSPVIQGNDVLHIRKVLRLKPGDRIVVEHQVTVGPKRWTAKTRGTVIRTERRRHARLGGVHHPR